LKKFSNFTILLLAAAGTFAILMILVSTGILDEYYTGILTMAGINIIMVLSLNLITGFGGQLALGHAGFMSVGAYSSAILTLKLGLPIYLTIPMAGLITAAFGVLIGIPSLRLKGDYLAITTLGFAEVIRVLMIYFDKLTGGAAGLKGISLFTTNYAINHVVSFGWVFVGVILTTAAIYTLINSSPGRAIISIREDEIAANSMGINVSYYKILAFTFSAFFAGIAGGLYAHLRGYLNPMDYGFMKSVDILVMMVLGGLGSITGSIVSSIVLTFLPEVLRFLADSRLVIFSFLLIIIMIFRPSGLMGNHEISIVKLLKEYSFKNILIKLGNIKLKKAGEDR
jgi:branched-chain amino acid transport system permease protein